MWRTLFTGVDNKSLDLGRVLWAKLSVVYSFLAVWHVTHGQPFDHMTFAAGAGAMLAAGSASLALKSKTEPQPGQTP